MSKIKKEQLVFYLSALAVLSAYVSITLFQVLFLLALILTFLLAIERIFKFSMDYLGIPIIGHITVLDISSLLFLKVPEQFRRLAEQNIFSLTYFIPQIFTKRNLKKLSFIIAFYTIFLGYLVSLKVFYTAFTQGNIKAFWGGPFIIGNLLAIPFFSSLAFITLWLNGNRV